MKTLSALDIEVLPNYFLLVLKSTRTGKIKQYELFGENKRFSKDEIRSIKSLLTKYTSFGFNSINYDMPLINYVLMGATPQQLYKVSKDIIENRKKAYFIYTEYEITKNNFDHFDLIEPSPAVMVSLKTYGTRLGSKKLKEFYLDPHEPINEAMLDEFRAYCVNDVDTTIDLYNAIKDRISLREDMMQQYDGIVDLRSKSDPQVAEAIFKYKLNLRSAKPDKVPTSITYKAPDYITFRNPELNKLKELMETHPIPVNQNNGQPKLPTEWNKYLKPKIGNTVYKIGLGGIHSQEKQLVVEANNNYVLRNADIASMYPSIILELGLYPKSLGKKFLNVYRDIYNTRLEAKHNGDKATNAGLKIALNGSYGKFGSKYSFLYAPHLMLSVTLTGQLMMLMLIEELEDRGFSVVSSNTDGIEVYCERDRESEFETIVFDWELTTGMNMEHGSYLGLYARDVNNYVAKYDGYVKAKGAYTETSLMKGRSTPIVATAVREFINSGKSMEDTIKECKDVNEFIAARNVKGGGCYKDKHIGKTVRWYYSLDGDTINYCSNGNKVAKTGEGNGVKPIMDLFDAIPDDLDYQWYFDEAVKLLNDLGVK